MSELSTFLKYLFLPSGFLKDFLSGIGDLLIPKRLSFLFIFASIISFFVLPYNKKLVAGMFLFMALLIQFRLIYKAGDHNRWKNERIKKVYTRKGKKEKGLSLGPSLEERSESGEEILQREMPEDTDTHPSDKLKGGQDGI